MLNSSHGTPPFAADRKAQHAVRRAWCVVQVVLSATAVWSLSTGCVRPDVSPAALQAPPEVIQSKLRFKKEYVLVPGDQVEVVVRREPDISRVLTVRPDGKISLPLLDDVQAAALTLAELDERLTERLAERLRDPEVTVVAQQVRQHVVYVIGDVLSPTAVALRDAPTAIQAIALAGGLQKSAARKDIAIIRLDPDGYVRALRVEVDLKGQPGPVMALAAMALLPGDVIFVPESGRSQFGRLLEDIVNRPLTGVSAALGIYVNFRLVEAVVSQ